MTNFLFGICLVASAVDVANIEFISERNPMHHFHNV